MALTIGSLLKQKNKTFKIDYFTKDPFPLVFEQLIIRKFQRVINYCVERFVGNNLFIISYK